MKAIIFIAGIGNRFRLVTDNPKCLVELDGKPLIIHHLDILDEIGIKQVVLVVGYKKEKIKEGVGDSYKGIKIKYIENKDYLKGSILSLLCAKDEFNDEIITIEGDVVFDKNLLHKLVNSKNKNCYLADPNYSPKIGDEYIVASNREGIIRTAEYNNKFKKQEGDLLWESVGIIKWSKTDSLIFRKAFEKLLISGVDDDVFENAMRYLINNNLCQFNIVSTEDFSWTDIDYPQDLEKAKQIYQK